MINFFMDSENEEVIDLFEYHEIKHTFNISESDFVLFDGGADVNPYLYGESKHNLTCSFYERDILSHKLYKSSISLNIPRIGICRGSQFLHVMNGGKLYQHVTGHCCIHDIILNDGRVMKVMCGHHQMGIVTPENRHQIIGWSYPRLSERYEKDNENVVYTIQIEPEVYQWDEKQFAVQFHPEWMDFDCESTVYFIDKVKQIVEDNK